MSIPYRKLRTRRAVLGWWWNVWVRRVEGELCYWCGRGYLLWWCEDTDWWIEVTEPIWVSEGLDGHKVASGLCCLDCFTRLAREKGYVVEWRPRVFRRLQEERV